VAIRFKFYDSSLCFVCSHLAAGGEHTERRYQDYQTIISKIAFTQKGSTKVSSILEHGHIFWFGDLNYRIDLKLTAILPAIKTNNIKGLLKKEQLLREKSAGKVFIGFKEGPITFLPTYKYQANTDIYDEKKKHRLIVIVYYGVVIKLNSYDIQHIVNQNVQTIAQ